MALAQRWGATILDIKSPLEFSVRAAGCAEAFFLFKESLNEHYSRHCSTLKLGIEQARSLKAGETVVAFHDSRWCRALVQSTHQYQLQVWLLDYGWMDLVTVDKLYKLDDEFSNNKPFALRCHLANLKEATTPQWLAVATQQMEGLKDRYGDEVQIDQLGDIEEADENDNVIFTDKNDRCFKSLPVNVMWSYTEASPLDPPVHKTVNLLHNLKTMQFFEPFEGLMDSLTEATDLLTTSDEIEFSKRSVEKEEHEPNFRWLNPEIPPEQEFLARCTHVDDSGQIYLQLENKKFLIKSVHDDLSCKYMGSKSGGMKPKEGSECIASFRESAKMVKRKLGYWFRFGAFEGGVEVPEDYSKSGIFHDELKFTFNKTNFDGIEDEKELQQRINNLLKNVKLDDKVKTMLEEGRMWTLDEVKAFLDAKKTEKENTPVKPPLESPVKPPVVPPVKPLALPPVKPPVLPPVKPPVVPPVKPPVMPQVKPVNLEKEQLHEEVVIAKDDIIKESVERPKNVVEGDFLATYNRKLSREITGLEKKKEELKKKVDHFRETVFNDGSKEVQLAKQEKDNKKKIAANDKELKKLEDLKIKKAILEHKKNAQEKLITLLKNIDEVKSNVESGMAKMKANQRRFGAWKFETVNKIGNSGKNFSIVNIGRSKAFQDQPEPFQKEYDRLLNVKAVEMSEPSWEEAIVALETQEEGADTEKEVVVFIMNVKQDMGKISSDVVLDVAVESEAKMMKRTVEMFQEKFKHWIVVIPPTTEDLTNVTEKLSEKIKGKELKIKICNLFKVQKEKEDEGFEKGSELWDEEKEGISNAGERYILSTMANMISELKTEKVKEICNKCGLIHSAGICPRELKEKSRKRKMAEENEEDIAIKKDKPSENDKQFETNKNLSRGKEKNQEESEDSEQKKYERSSTIKRKTSDGKDESRSRGENDPPPRRDNKNTRSGRRSPGEKDEKCPKCLQNHYVDGCWVGRGFKCLNCGALGHHRNIHYPQTEDGREMIKVVYHGKIIFGKKER